MEAGRGISLAHAYRSSHWLFTAPAIEYSWGKKRDVLVVIILAFLGLGIQLIVLAKDPLISLVNSVVYGGINL